MELWIDGSKISDYFSSVVDASVPLSGGAHTATFVEVDSTGSYIKSPDIHTNVQPGNGACVPSNPGVLICQPASGGAVNSPVTITAGAVAQNANITAIRAYVDNGEVFTSNN